MIHTAPLFIFGIPLLVGGIILFFYGFFEFKKRQLVENTPTSKIRSIAMGLVEIVGEVVPIEHGLFKSPFSETDCVYYKYTVDELRSTGKHTQWVTIKQDEKRWRFYLKDETGMVLVDPEKAKIAIAMGNEFRSGLRKDPPEGVMRFLETCNLSHDSFLGFNKTMRYREWFIAPKENLYIMGTAGENPFVDHTNVKNETEDVMIHKGDYEKFYYISDKSERQIIFGLDLQLVGCFIIGPILIISGVILTFIL